MEWHGSVLRITGPVETEKPYATGFAVAREGDGLFLITCWHVVEAIGRDRLFAKGKPCKVVSTPGDNYLDLAVLRLPGLPGIEPMPLSIRAKESLPVSIYGYGPEGRQLSGSLGVPTSWPHASGQDVGYWDYYLDTSEGVGAFERIKAGYSGSPLRDPATGQVVAVVTDKVGEDKGYAVDVRELVRVYPDAWRWLHADSAPDWLEDEYSAEPGESLAMILDHQEQLAHIAALRQAGAADCHLVLVGAVADDWPHYLADHIHLDPWPDDQGSASRCEELLIDFHRDDGFWDALVKATPGGPRAPDPDAQREQVRRWVNAKGLLVLYAPLVVERHGRRLPRILRSARSTLDGLGPFAPGASLLVLVVCMPEGERPPFWWPLFDRFVLSRLEGIVRPPPLGLLCRADVQLWHDGFPKCQRPLYDRGSLKAELLRLFDQKGERIRYGRVRDCLVGSPPGTGALARARRRAD